jgi:uncharacterized membrane protein
MATMTVLEFETPEGADNLARTLNDLQKQRLITILDAAIVSWPHGKKKPKLNQMHNLAAVGSMSGAFWGFLFGLIFLVPLFGMALGAGMGALAGSMRDVGIDDNFIKKVREDITEGTSALFLLSADEVTDRLAEELKQRGVGSSFKLVASNLSSDQEARMREIFGAE